MKPKMTVVNNLYMRLVLKNEMNMNMTHTLIQLPQTQHTLTHMLVHVER